MKKFKKLLIVFMLILLPFSSLKAKTLFYYKGPSKQTRDHLVVYNFKIKGKHFSVGQEITVEFVLKNVSRKTIVLGKYGIFVGCRDPQNFNRDFGHRYKYYKLRPKQKIHFSAKIKIDKEGRWIFWPGYNINNHWGPFKWCAAKLVTKHIIILKPPYESCTHWGTSPGDLWKGAKVIHKCNSRTGYIGLLATAGPPIGGGAAADALHFFSFKMPYRAKVHVKATFIYVGGATTIGYGCFAGTQAVYMIGKKYYRKDIEPGLDYKIATEKVIDLAVLAVDAPELKGHATIAKALKVLDEINDVYSFSKSMIEAYQNSKAKKYVLKFSFKAKKGWNTIGIGLRTNVSAVVTGSAFGILGGQLQKVEITY